MGHFQKAKEARKDNVLATIGMAQLHIKNGMHLAVMLNA